MYPRKRFKPHIHDHKPSNSQQHLLNLENENTSSSRLTDAPSPLEMEHFAQLQRTIGNRATSRLMSDVVQPQSLRQEDQAEQSEENLNANINRKRKRSDSVEASAHQNERELRKNQSGYDEAEDDSLEEIFKLLDTISVNVQPNRGPEKEVNLGQHFRKMKNYNITALALKQEVEALLIMEETSPSPDPDRLTAFYWVLQELYIPPTKKGEGGGGGNLTVKMNSPTELNVSGRPGFEKNAIALPGMKTGYHRRHIIAWHTLANAVQNLINTLLTLQTKEEGMSNAIKVLLQLAVRLQEKEQKEEAISEEALQKNDKKKSQEKAELPTEQTTDAKDLCILVNFVLSKLNSNVLNLWPGDGYENSLINTYQSMFRLWAKQCIVLNKDQIKDWKEKKHDDLLSRIDAKKGKFALVVTEFNNMLSAWTPEEDNELSASEQLSKFLLMCADSFEVDFPYSVNRKSFEDGQEISSHILGLAETLLKWSENEEEAFKGKTLSELTISFETVLNEFMFPPETTKLSKSTGTKAKQNGSALDKGNEAESGQEVSKLVIDNMRGWDRKRLEGVGIPNAGNTCYIASVMQLINTIPQYSNLFEKNLEEGIHEDVVLEVIMTGRDLLHSMYNLSATLEQITAFRSALIQSGWIRGQMEEAGTQQDAGELMTYILDLLGSSERVGRLHEWQDRGSDVVNAPEHTSDSMINLSGIRSEGEGQSIEELLAHNLSPARIETELLSNNTVREHQWRLEGTLPNVLTFQINRFSFSTILGRVFKLKEKVTTGSTLILPTAMTPDGNTVSYELHSFIVHIGESTNSGHYVSYVRREDGWYLCDDAVISKVTDEEVHEMVKEAYILTYTK